MRAFSLSCFLICTLAQAAALQPPPVIGRSWIIGDSRATRSLLRKAPTRAPSPLPLTKLMTAYLVFAALREKKFAEQQVTVSARACVRRLAHVRRAKAAGRRR